MKYTFTVDARNLLKLQELVKLTNGRFASNPWEMSDGFYLVSVEFGENSDFIRFMEERNRMETVIVEINKPKSLVSKLFNRVKLLFRR